MANALIIYFSVTGRTKQVAEIIAEELTNYSVTIEPILYKGKKFLKDNKKLMQGDYSTLEIPPSIIDLTPFDLLCIGMPVHGGRPSYAFDAYLKQMKGMEGKKIIIFATCRFLWYMTQNMMRTAVEQNGGTIVGELWLKNFFRLKTAPAKEFAAEINES